MGMKLEKWQSRTSLTYWTLIMDHPLIEISSINILVGTKQNLQVFLHTT